MIHNEITFSDNKNASIYYQVWRPDTAPRAVIVLAHGAGEHSGRYDRFAKFFVERGIAVAALDFPGHGRSDGTPGHIDRFSDYIDSLDLFRARIAQETNDLPQFLLGHSMGGLISASYLLQNQESFVGCILSGPAIRSDVEPSGFQLRIIRALGRFTPKLGALQLDAEGVSRDPVEVKRYIDDPLVHNGKMSARLVCELFDAMSNVQTRAGEITLPLIVLHGGDDAMTSPEGSKFLVENVNSTDKTLEIYPGLYHEIFNEPEREQIFTDVAKWCDERLAAS